MKLAKQNGIQYIALPAISCGVYRYVLLAFSFDLPSHCVSPMRHLICQYLHDLTQCSYPPKEASKIAVSTAQRFSNDIKEVSSGPVF